MGAFNGSGIFVRSYNWQQDAANNVDITASRMDTEMDGFATGLSNCVTRDGQGRMGTDFLPVTDNAYGLGSASFRWASINGVPAANITQLNAVKPSQTSRANTIVPADDPHLILTLTAGTWRVEAQIFFNAAAAGSTPGLVGGFHFAGTCTQAYWQVDGSANHTSFNPFVVSAVGANQTQVSSFSSTGAGTPDCLTFVGVIPVTVSGILAFSWCQFNSSVNATTLLVNSFLTARRLA